ncbi:MAG: PIG-L deacetylase family protein [Armatimonadota bacterium]
MATYLAFVAHRDDELNIAGTVMRMLDDGHRCVITCITNGSRGGLADRDEEERKSIARSEFEAATDVIGCERRWLDINEHEFPRPETQIVARERIFEVLCEVDPDVLILHPGPPLGRYDYHEHHWLAARLPYAESYSASNPNYARPRGLAEMRGVPAVFHMCPIGMPMVPDRYVNITQYLDRKLEAARCYASQVQFLADHDSVNFVEVHRAQSIVYGSYCGVPAAEAFCASPAWNRLVAEAGLPEKGAARQTHSRNAWGRT